MNTLPGNTSERVVTELNNTVRICSPGKVRGWRTSPTTAQLTWDEPYSTCHICPDAISYEVSGIGITTTSVTRPPCDITGLKVDTEYLLQVTAKASIDNVSTASFFRLADIIRAPSEPGTPELGDLSQASATLLWEPSIHPWGDIIYRIYLNGSLVKQVSTPGVSLDHLQSHTDYRVEVRAMNAGGVSEPSFIDFKTRVSTPTNLRFSHRNGLCRLAWDPVFRKRPAHEVSINGQVFTTAPGRWGFNFKLADISPGPAPHHFKCEVEALLDGARSDTGTLDLTLADGLPPSRPGVPQVTGITDTSATVTWAPSDDNVGVTGYRVVLNGMLVYPTTDTRFTFNKLIAGAYYYVFVRAHDKDGNVSTPGAITVFKTTGQAPAPRPSAPHASVTAVTSTSAKLAWKYQEGVADSGVRILVNGEFLRDVLFLEYVVLKNLIPNVEYEISICAFDILGQLSDPTIIVHEPTDVTPPSMPENLRRSAVTFDSVTLVWDESTDEIGVCDYVIYNNHEYFDRTPLTSYSAVDLLPGSYSFEVCAMDACGNVSAPAVITLSIDGKP